MKYIAKALVMVTFFSLIGCGFGDNGELIGVQGRSPWFHPQPFGTVYIPTGTFHTGQSDEDIFHTYIAPNKQISVVAFWMDDTEITNNEYRQFVAYVKDSVMRNELDYKLDGEDEYDDYEILDYEEDVYEEDFYEEAGDRYYYKGSERYDHKKEWDIRKLDYTYTFVDLRAASAANYLDNNRADFLIKKTEPIYPDTLVWIRDFTYSYNEPMARQYYSHPKYDDYPVVGITWHQANAFCNWRTKWMDRYWNSIEDQQLKHGDFLLSSNGNLQQEVDVIITCTPGAALILGIVKDVC